ncbi:MAG: 4-hydroxy-tetrahydrodipicolinate reductase [Deltaproteobacteria bacterium]|nr:4-hydroxy-tetrahydrodipicolinate reductase [Deltaproteobacteria bacterium]MDZ4224913.1 4-hydroxy-tetrahydrodipicolinate reductase [bacterium]
MTMKLFISGATGRMGKLICKLAQESNAWQLTDDFETCQIIIDFSAPEGTEKALTLARERKIPIVIGTTGLNETQKAQVTAAAKEIPVVFSPNMSVGVNLLFKLIETAAKTLEKDYKIKISETHHIHKKDKPSGTAKRMGEIVEKIRKEKPPIESIREGEVIGDHTIIFGNDAEHLAILHRAVDRQVFAAGALKAAQWIIGKSPGLYTMQDVLGLERALVR